MKIVFICRAMLATGLAAFAFTAVGAVPANGGFENGLEYWEASGLTDGGAFWMPEFKDSYGDPVLGSARAGLFDFGTLWTCINIVPGEMPGILQLEAHEAGSLSDRPTLSVDSFGFNGPDCTGATTTPLFVHYSGPVEPNFPFGGLITAPSEMPITSETLSVDVFLDAQLSNSPSSYTPTAIIDNVMFVGASSTPEFGDGFE